MYDCVYFCAFLIVHEVGRYLKNSFFCMNTWWFMYPYPFVSVPSHISFSIQFIHLQLTTLFNSKIMYNKVLFFACFAGFRIFSPDTVPALSTFLPGLHASDLGGRSTSWFACGGKRHYGGFWECQPRHVCHHRQVGVIIPACMNSLSINDTHSVVCK